jgi:hypothetical protein
MTQDQAPGTGLQTKKAVWAKRLGVGAFMFFLIKGLLWLTVPALVVATTR